MGEPLDDVQADLSRLYDDLKEGRINSNQARAASRRADEVIKSEAAKLRERKRR